jgi:DNA-binding transcriptional LysR family regulator
MGELDDYVLYAGVIENGGFARAGRVLGMAKSKLSRRVAALEARLGVRLIERSTRQFHVTAVGEALYEECRTIVSDVERARGVTAVAVGEPRGAVRFSCPTGLIDVLSAAFAEYVRRYPKVRLAVVATDRPVDLIRDRIDVALRVRTDLDGESGGLTVRTLGRSRRILVAAPALAERLGRGGLEALRGVDTLSSTDQPGEISWDLVSVTGGAFHLRHDPRLRCETFAALVAAAVAELGVALLPDHAVAPEIAAGRLAHVFPEWHAQEGVVHLVFTGRRGLPPAVRALIDDLAAVFKSRVVPGA